MTPSQILFLKELDPKIEDGTIQAIIMGSKLNELPFVEVLKFLVTQLKKEKDVLTKMNIELCQNCVCKILLREAH
jgi:hypothetical protein